MRVRNKIGMSLLAATGMGIALIASAGSALANDPAPASCALANHTFSYSVNGGAPVTTKAWPQTGLFMQGDVVTVTFTVPAGCAGQQFTLAAYRAPSANAKNLSQQILDNYQSQTFGPGTYSLTATVPNSPPGNPADCSPQHNNSNGGGANQYPGPYDSTCNGSASGNGASTNNNSSKPCAGCVGNADNKNPPGQYPNGNDPNAGYECDSNQGVGQTNPAHTGCQSYQLDFAYGPVLQQVGNGVYYGAGLIAGTHG